MQLYERIKHLRKDILGLTQTDFGKRLGVNRDTIKNIELNALAKPEQKEPLYRLICKEFDINYDWLINGTGDVFVESDESIVDELAAKYNLDDMGRRIIENFLKLNDAQRKVIEDYIYSLLPDDEGAEKTVKLDLIANGREPDTIKTTPEDIVDIRIGKYGK